MTITNEDNMSLMSRYGDDYFDLAIVDPPYGIGDINQKRSRRIHKNMYWNDLIPGKDYFSELIRISKNQIIWGVNYYGERVKSVGRIIHDKTGAGTKPQLPGLSDADIASHSFGVNIKIFRYIWQGNVQGNTINWKNKGINSRIYPTQKPVELYEWLLNKYAKEGDIILDTHLGSASIAIACQNLGFDLTACEIDKEYYDSAINRIRNHRKQLVMFKTV
ncbi:MAG: DNA methyltransferase [Candidatus Anammoxibacter sp.]